MNGGKPIGTVELSQDKYDKQTSFLAAYYIEMIESIRWLSLAWGWQKFVCYLQNNATFLECVPLDYSLEKFWHAVGFNPYPPNYPFWYWQKAQEEIGEYSLREI